MPAEQLKIKAEMAPSKQVRVLHITGSLDAHTFENLQEALNDEFEQCHYKLILELSNVPYMSSAGAGVLIGALSQTQANGGMLALASCGEGVSQVIEILGLDQMFTVAPDVDGALKAFQ